MSVPNEGGAIDPAGAEDLSTEDSPSSESNPETDDDNVSEDEIKDRAENAGSEEEGEEGQPKDEPLHKNPRFKEVIRQNREMRKKLADMESEKAKAKEDKPGDERESKPRNEVYSKLFEGAPQFEFKEPKQYQDIGDLYQDFRTALLGDLDYLRQSDDQARSEATAKFESQLSAIKEDLGDQDAFDSFATFLEQAINKYPTADVDMVFDLWLEKYEAEDDQLNNSGKEDDAKQKRKPSKVNRSSKPPKAKGSKPSYDYISKKSMDDIMSDLVG